MTDTTPRIPVKCSPAHYPDGVARNVDLTPEQAAAIAKVRAAAARANDAQVELDAAIDARKAAIREVWPILSELGPTRVSAEIGADIMAEGVVRADTVDERRAARLDARRRT